MKKYISLFIKSFVIFAFISYIIHTEFILLPLYKENHKLSQEYIKNLISLNTNNFITYKIDYPHMTIKNNSPYSIYIYSEDKEWNGYELKSNYCITTEKEEIILKRIK